MTKKDYEVIAKGIAKAKSSLSYASVCMPETDRSIETLAGAIAYELKLDNGRFNEEKFLTACGLTK